MFNRYFKFGTHSPSLLEFLLKPQEAVELKECYKLGRFKVFFLYAGVVLGVPHFSWNLAHLIIAFTTPRSNAPDDHNHEPAFSCPRGGMGVLIFLQSSASDDNVHEKAVPGPRCSYSRTSFLQSQMITFRYQPFLVQMITFTNQLSLVQMITSRTSCPLSR